MNMIRTALLGAMIVIGSTAMAEAATPYVSGSIGIGMRGDSDVEVGSAKYSASYDTGIVFAGAVGLESGNMRVEGEIGYQKNGIENNDDFDISMMTYLANGYLDFNLPTAPITPYITAGIGLADVKAEGFGLNDNSCTVLAGQVGVGAAYAISPLIKLDMKYRYLMAGDAEFDNRAKVSIDSHNVMFGLRAGF